MNCNDFIRWMLDVNSADLDFKLKKDKKFSVNENDHGIKVWSESNLVYAMVLQKNA